MVLVFLVGSVIKQYRHKEETDQYQYVGTCAPTPPLTPNDERTRYIYHPVSTQNMSITGDITEYQQLPVKFAPNSGLQGYLR